MVRAATPGLPVSLADRVPQMHVIDAQKKAEEVKCEVQSLIWNGCGGYEPYGSNK